MKRGRSCGHTEDRAKVVSGARSGAWGGTRLAAIAVCFVTVVAMCGGVFARTVEVTSVGNGVASLAFGGSDGKSYTLVMASGDVDKGADFNAWKATRVIGTVGADEAAREVVLGDADFVRFFLREDDPSLPFAKRLLYVESSAAQYIDTGIIGKSGISVDFELAFSSSTPLDRTVIGCRKDSGNTRFFPIHMNKKAVGSDTTSRYRWCAGYGAFIYGKSPYISELGLRYHVTSTLEYGNVSMEIDGVSMTYEGSSAPSPNQTVDTGLPLYIFAANMYGSPGQYSAVRFFRGKIYFNGELQRDYIPCELADGTGALYDRVSGTVFRNGSSTALIKGPELAFPQATAASSATVRPALDARLVARWNFNDFDSANPTSTNILHAAVGRDAIPCFFEGAGSAPITDGTLGGMYVVSNGLARGEYALAIPRYHHIKLPFPEGGINDTPWTMKITFMSPGSATGKWRAIYSRHLANNTDGDLFINPSEKIGMGGAGWSDSYSTAVAPDVWHTLTLSGGDHRRDVFLDGVTQAIYANTDATDWFNGLDAILLCADDTEAAGALLYVASVEIWRTGGAREGRLPHYTRAGMTGEWTFPAADPLAASKGYNLEYAMRKESFSYSPVSDGVAPGDTGIRCGELCGLKCHHALPIHSDYSVVMDVRMPADAAWNKLHVLFNPYPELCSDGAAYLKCVAADDVRLWLASGTWTPDAVCRAGEWIRFVITYVNGGNRVDYINGVKIDSRAHAAMQVTGDVFHFLVENNNEADPLDISYAAIYDRALTDEEVAELHARPLAHDADGRLTSHVAPAGVWIGQQGQQLVPVVGEALTFEDGAYVWTRSVAPASATYVFDIQISSGFNGGMLALNAADYGTGLYPGGNFITTDRASLGSTYSNGAAWGYWTYDRLPLGARHRVAVTWSKVGHVLYTIDGEPVSQLMPDKADASVCPTAVMRFLVDAECDVTRIAAYDVALTPEEVKALGSADESPFALGNAPVASGSAKVATARAVLDTVVFTGTFTDADGDPAMLQFDFGDGIEATSDTYLAPGTTFTVEHIFLRAGTLTPRVRALSSDGLVGAWVACPPITVTETTLNVAEVLLRRPWQQNVYTNRFTILCETARKWPGLELQYGENYEHSQACTYTFASAGGTYIAKARVRLDNAAGTTVKYRLAIPGCVFTGDAPHPAGEVTLWPMTDTPFVCSIWGDNQQGARAGDWDADPYLYVTRLFEHMTARKVDFGVSTGDMASSANYATQIAPLILERNNGIFGWHTPYYIAWGNHDTSYPDNKPYFEASSIDEPGYGTSDVGNAYLYRGETLFILLDDSVKGSAETKTWLANLLATERARNAKFRLVFHHVPIYTETSGSMTTALEQTFIDGRVDVVFGGHMHGYERINRNGVVYLINGCAGYLDHPLSIVHNWGDDTAAGGHNPVPALWARQVTSQPGTLAAAEPIRMGMFVGYGELKVVGGTLTYLAHCFNADGSYVGVVDSFTLTSKGSYSVSDGSEPIEPGAVSVNLIAATDFDLIEETGTTSVHGTVGGPFRFAKSPVTRGQWTAWRQARGEDVAVSPEDAAKPATGMSKKEIGQFLAWINGEGGNYRLPTAAEWAAAKFRKNGEWLGSIAPGDVSEWTSTVVPTTGRCRIMGGNSVAVAGTWTSLEEKPEVASDECSAVYLGFRLAQSVGEWNDPADPIESVMAAVAAIDPASDTGAYKWENGTLVSIADAWFAQSPGALEYTAPVVLTGRGALAHTNDNAVALRGGLLAPNAASFTKKGTGALVISGAVKVGPTTGSGAAEQAGWLFTAEGALTLDGVRYIGTSAQFRTADRELHMKGVNDFSDATLVFNADSVTNLVCVSGEAAASLIARNARQYYQNVNAGYGIGEGVTFTVCDDLKLEQAAYSVDGTLRTASLNMTSNMGPWFWGAGEVRMDAFGMYKNSWLRFGVSNVVITSERPCRSNNAETRHRLQIEGSAVRLTGTCDWTIPKKDTFGVNVEVGSSRARTDGPRLVIDTLDPDDGVTAHTFTFMPTSTLDAWGLTKVNPGTLVISGSFDHSGETRLEGGVLAIRGATAFSAAPFRATGGELAFSPESQLTLSQGAVFDGGKIRLLPDERGSYDYWRAEARKVATAASIEGLPHVHSAGGWYRAEVVENPDGTASVVVSPDGGFVF